MEDAELRKLDCEIATKVFGAKVTFLNQKNGWRIDYVADDSSCNDPIITDMGTDGEFLKRYSTDIKAAWSIVEHMRFSGSGFKYEEQMIPEPVGNEHYIAEFVDFSSSSGKNMGSYISLISECDAICRAALKAVGA